MVMITVPCGEGSDANMRLKFPTFFIRCISGNASKSAHQITSSAITPHFQKVDDFFSSNAELLGDGEYLSGSVDPSLLPQLQLHGSAQTPYLLNKFISLCAKSSLLEVGVQFHPTVIKMGFGSNVYITSALAYMYGKSGAVSSAQRVFDETLHRNAVTWNSLMSAYLHNQLPELAIKLFVEMLKEGIFPTAISLSTVLSGCVQLEARELGAQVHSFCLKTGFCFNVAVGTGLIGMYSKFSAIDASRKVFNEMPEKNIFAWTSMVTGYGQSHQTDEAMVLVREMLRLGVKPSEVTYTCLLSSFHYPDDSDYCRQIHCRLIYEGLESDIYLAATLATVYSECNTNLEDFYRICSNITIWDQVSWNAVIAGFSNLGICGEAVLCFRDMRQAGIVVDFFTFTSVLKATGTLSDLEVGRQVHCLVIKSGYASDTYVQNGLISMYARCGSISNAKGVFLSMDKQDVISWNSLISGFAQHGYGREAVEMFEEMKRSVVKPDLITFLAVLTACSHVGLLNKGLEYFNMMKSNFFPQRLKSEHYACVVDLYGRAGYLHEAEAFIDSMPIEPGPSVFKALLSACKVHGNTEIAARAARKLVELSPYDPASYVLLASIFANDGHWDNAAGVRKLMCYRGVQKKPGSSWV